MPHTLGSVRHGMPFILHRVTHLVLRRASDCTSLGPCGCLTVQDLRPEAAAEVPRAVELAVPGKGGIARSRREAACETTRALRAMLIAGVARQPTRL